MQTTAYPNSLQVILWKQYRENVQLWCFVALLGLAVIGMLPWFSLSPRDLHVTIYLAVACLPILFALGASATAFAGEAEAETDHWLRSMAMPNRSLWWGKTGFNLLATAALMALFASFASVRLGTRVWEHEPWSFVGLGGLAVLEVIAWTTLFSLLMRHVIAAAVTGALVAIVVGSLITVSCEAAHQEGVGFVIRVIVFAVVLLADRSLIAKWNAQPVSLASPRRLHNRTREAQRSRLGLLPPAWERHVWLTLRQAGTTVLPSYGVALGMILSTLLFGISTGQARFMASILQGASVSAAIVAMGTLGALTFAQDHTRQQVRFLVNQGVSLTGYWVLRCLTLLVFAIPAIGLIVWGTSGTTQSTWLPVFIGCLSLVMGQCCSLLVRRPINALVATVLLAMPVCSLLAAAYREEVLWFATGAAVILVFVLSGWLNLSNCLVHEAHWRRRGYALASWIVPLTLVCLAYDRCRAIQLAEVPKSYWDRRDAEIAEEGDQATRHYLMALEYLSRVDLEPSGYGAELAEVRTGDARAELEQAEQEFLRGAALPAVAFDERLERRAGRISYTQWAFLVSVMEELSQEYARDGQVDRFLSLNLALMRARVQAPWTFQADKQSLDHWLVSVCNHPDTTEAQVEQALLAIWPQATTPMGAVAHTQMVNSWRFSEQLELEFLWQGWRYVLPGEFTYRQRQLDRAAYELIELQERKSPAAATRRNQLALASLLDLQTANSKLTRIRLLLELWRRREGAYPKHLDELNPLVNSLVPNGGDDWQDGWQLQRLEADSLPVPLGFGIVPRSDETLLAGMEVLTKPDFVEPLIPHVRLDRDR